MELATQSATGCLTLTDRDGEHAVVWFRDGLVYAVSVPGRRMSANDGSRLGVAVPLAERCVR